MTDHALHTDWNYETTAARRDRFYAASLTRFTPYREPIVFKRGQGQYLWDADDRKYIDLLGMNVCISVGHSHPTVVAAAVTVPCVSTSPHSEQCDTASTNSAARPSRSRAGHAGLLQCFMAWPPYCTDPRVAVGRQVSSGECVCVQRSRLASGTEICSLRPRPKPDQLR